MSKFLILLCMFSASSSALLALDYILEGSDTTVKVMAFGNKPVVLQFPESSLKEIIASDAEWLSEQPSKGRIEMSPPSSVVLQLVNVGPASSGSFIVVGESDTKYIVKVLSVDHQMDAGDDVISIRKAGSRSNQSGSSSESSYAGDQLQLYRIMIRGEDRAQGVSVSYPPKDQQLLGESDIFEFRLFKIFVAGGMEGHVIHVVNKTSQQQVLRPEWVKYDGLKSISAGVSDRPFEVLDPRGVVRSVKVGERGKTHEIHTDTAVLYGVVK
ncbi:MAG: hypothetical protein HQL31_02485 [Planctomycetes bacterium]|nr:hypothetical protein [Planctomycetota bacterium]